MKLGDRQTGWIPGPEEERKVHELFQDLLAQLDLDIPVLTYHYGIELETIQQNRR